MAAAISRPDQSAHCSSSVMTSSSTQESTRVPGRIAAGSLATQQRHDLVGAHPRHFLASRRIAQPPNQPLPPALGSLGADDLKRAADFDDLHLVPGMHPVLGPQIRWDGQLALAVQNHDDLRERVTYYDYYVILPTPRRGRKETATDESQPGPFDMRILLVLTLIAQDAAESQVRGGGVDGLALAGGRAVAQAVVRSAEVRAALDDAARDVRAGLVGGEAVFGRGDPRVPRHTAGAVRGRRGVEVAGPFPDVPGHVVEAEGVGREAADGGGAVAARRLQVLPGELALPGVGHRLFPRGGVVAPGVGGAVEAAAGGALP